MPLNQALCGHQGCLKKKFMNVPDTAGHKTASHRNAQHEAMALSAVPSSPYSSHPYFAAVEEHQSISMLVPPTDSQCWSSGPLLPPSPATMAKQ